MIIEDRGVDGSSDVFRFAVLRAPNIVTSSDQDTIDVGKDTPDDSVLLQRLRESIGRTRSAATRGVLDVAIAYMDGQLEGATLYASGPKDLDLSLHRLSERLRGAPSEGWVSAIQDALSEGGLDPETLGAWQERLRDSFHAAIVARRARSKASRDLLAIERAIRVIAAVRRVAQDAASSVADVQRALNGTIAVSKAIFPLVDTSGAKARRAAALEAAQTKRREYNDKLSEHRARLFANRRAISELKAIYESAWQDSRIAQTEPPTVDLRAPSSESFWSSFAGWFGWGERSVPTRTVVSPKIRVLTEAQIASLSADTRAHLGRLGIEPRSTDVPGALARLEADRTATGRRLYQGIGRHLSVRYGAGWEVMAPGYGVFVDDEDDGAQGIPGACPADPLEDESSGQLPEGMGLYQSLGILDLNVTRQSLLRYEVGEIAHIENVMRGEARERTHRRLDRTEELQSVVTERTQELERDLQTTSRYELQKEVDSTVSQQSSREAGLTVSGSYGMSVEFEANAGAASEQSSTKANRQSSSFSKEVVDRSVQRIQERVREERSRLTIQEVEVINKHAFTNDASNAEHITGIYRWMDKIYESQVFNYGKREIIEVLVPEPGAFLRYVARNKPKEGVTVDRPIEPGYCSAQSGAFVPLSIESLSEDNYQYWVSQYQVTDVGPPPREFVTIGTAFSREPTELATGTSTHIVNYHDTTLQVPHGYVARRGWYTMPWTLLHTLGQIAVGRHKITFNVQDALVSDQGAIEVALDGEQGPLPIAVSLRTLGYYSATVEIECERAQEALERWKIDTFNAIMSRYQQLKDEYDQAIRQVDDEQLAKIAGRNPAENREIERNEIKRLVIAQMTGQRFDDFDAMRAEVPPLGYPEHDVQDAWDEGRYVRFVEQAFEWENMIYLFYPYFWGKKKQWPKIINLDDPDPIFKAFLQAGYSRVNIPVRPGFEAAVNVFLSTGQLPWSAGDDPVVSPEEGDEQSDPFLTIAEELRGQGGAVYFKSDGRVFQDSGDALDVVHGRGTTFNADDLDREITISGEKLMIRGVDEAGQSLTLDRELREPLAGDQRYGIGAKQIEAPWQVRIPTSLVFLTQDSDPSEQPGTPE